MKKMKMFYAILLALVVYAGFFEKPSQDSHTQFAFFQLALPIISAIAGGLANRKSKASQESNSTTSSTITPNVDPAAAGLKDSIISQYMKSLMNPGDLDGFEASNVDQINKTRGAQANSTKENLSARGISGPALDFAMTNVDNQRYSDIIDFRNKLPQMRQNMQNQILQNAGNFFSQVPVGQSSTSNTTGTGTSTQPGNVAGGVLGNSANTLAYLYGQGAFKKQA